MTRRFSELLAIDRALGDQFRCRPPGGGFLFGGLSMALMLSCAAETVEASMAPMSLHATFLAGGDWAGPHDMEVRRLNDNRSFAVRRVEMSTSGRLAVIADVVFHQFEDGDDLQFVPIPDAPAPETLQRFDDPLSAKVLDFRPLRPATVRQERIHPFWCRPYEDVHGHLLACALAYASDYWVYATPFPADSGRGANQMARTYSHTLILHRPLVAGAWWFMDCAPLSVSGGRFLSQGTAHSDSGDLLATFIQQGYIRPAK